MHLHGSDAVRQILIRPIQLCDRSMTAFQGGRGSPESLGGKGMLRNWRLHGWSSHELRGHRRLLDQPLPMVRQGNAADILARDVQLKL